MVKAEFTDASLRKFFKTMEKVEGKLKRDVINEVNATSLEIATDAKRSAPVDEGRLRSSIGILRSRPDGLGTVIGTNVTYAPVVEFGSRAHEIRIKNKSVLTNGKVFFGKSVNHPGTKPQPFLYPAYEKGKKNMISRLTRLLRSL